MTTIETHPDDPVAAAPAGGSAVASLLTGIGAWTTTTDHKRIGRLYAGFGLVILIGSAVLALLLGVACVDGNFIDNGAYLQLIQMYRVGLVFGGIAPLAIGLAVAAVPLQLGARSIAFPRVALAGFYAWLGGTALVYAALAANGGAGGADADMVDLFLTGLGLASLGLCATAASVATSVLTTRAPGMTMRRVPLFAWSALIGAIAILLVLPVLIGVLIYLYVDHRLGAQGNFLGVEGIGAWIAWMFTVPTVVVFAIPAVGFAAGQFPIAFKTRLPMRGAMLAAIALIGVTAYAGSTQQFVHDVTFDTSGETFIRGAVPFLLFAGLPLLGVTLVLLLSLLAVKDGIGNGAPSVRAPFVFGFLGLALVGAGIAANFLQGITDLELIDRATNTATTFEEGATLLVVYGVALGAMGALVFWAPKWWGRLVSDAQVLPLAVLGLLVTVMAAGPLLVLGFLDQIGGYPSSQAEAELIMTVVDNGDIWMTLSLVGHGIVALTLLAFAGLLIKVATGDGDTADQDPYGGQTIEWGAASPAPVDNFEQVPTVASAEPLFVQSERSRS